MVVCLFATERHEEAQRDRVEMTRLGLDMWGKKVFVVAGLVWLVFVEGLRAFGGLFVAIHERLAYSVAAAFCWMACCAGLRQKW